MNHYNPGSTISLASAVVAHDRNEDIQASLYRDRPVSPAVVDANHSDARLVVDTLLARSTDQGAAGAPPPPPPPRARTPYFGRSA